MEIKKINKHFTAKFIMSEKEIQFLVSLFEENCVLRQIPIEKIRGLREELYKSMVKILTHQD